MNKKAILGFAFSMLITLSIIQGIEVTETKTNQVAGAVTTGLTKTDASAGDVAWGAVAGAATAGSGLLTGAAFGAVICPWCAVGAVVLGA